VGYLDSGVAGDQPALVGKVLAFKDFCTTEPRVQKAFDNTGHGTHAAGTICGSKMGVGVAPGASLVVGRIFRGSVTPG